jgi:hypothetical protein
MCLFQLTQPVDQLWQLYGSVADQLDQKEGRQRVNTEFPIGSGGETRGGLLF